MRVFNNESMWDKETQSWLEMYTIDGFEVDEETYMEQFKVEELATEEDNQDIIDPNCKCCNCNNDDCADFNCTCGESDYCKDNELKNGNMFDDENYYECQCEDCIAMREAEFEQEDECFCQECNIPREQELITEVLDFIFDNNDACINCTIDKIIETLYKFKNLGILEAKQDMKDFLED